MPTFSLVGGSHIPATTSGGRVAVVNNLGTTATQVAGMNPLRTRITFANPGTVTIYVGPTVNVAGDTFTPSLLAPGGTFPLVSFGMLTIDGECQTPWQAFSASGLTSLTIMESHL